MSREQQQEAEAFAEEFNRKALDLVGAFHRAARDPHARLLVRKVEDVPDWLSQACEWPRSNIQIEESGWLPAGTAVLTSLRPLPGTFRSDEAPHYALIRFNVEDYSE